MGIKITLAATAIGLASLGAYIAASSEPESAAVRPEVERRADAERFRILEDAEGKVAVKVAESGRTTIEPANTTEIVVAATQAESERYLSGRVIDPRGKTVAGAKITIRRDDLREYNNLDTDLETKGVLVAEVETNALGEFSIELETGRPYVLRATKPGFASAIRPDRYAGEVIEIRLGFGATFAGRVVRAKDGVGIPARIRGTRKLVSESIVFDERTGPKGAFRFQGLEALDLWIEIIPDEASRLVWQRVQLVAGDVIERKFECGTGLTVQGRITDGLTGQPVQGATIGEGRSFERSVVSDARGNYVLEHFTRANGFSAVVRAEGYGRLEKYLGEPVNGVLSLNFELTRGWAASGRVVDSSGAPIQDAYVAAFSTVDEIGRQKPDWRSTRTDVDGRFELADLRSDARHALSVISDGYGSVTYDLPPVGDPGHKIEVGAIALQPSIVLRGLVVDTSKQPLTNCALKLVGINRNRQLLGGAPIANIEQFSGTRNGRTDHSGRFAFASLAPGEYHLTIGASGNELKKEVVIITGDEPFQKVRVEVAYGLAISGQVLGPDGQPLASVMIHTAPIDGTPGQEASRLTDANGRFELKGLAPGNFYLNVFPTGMGSQDGPVALPTTLQVYAGQPDLEIRLRSVMTVKGIVLDADGQAVRKSYVRALGANAIVLATTFSDENGRFVLSLKGDDRRFDLIATPALEGGSANFLTSVDESIVAKRRQVEAGQSEIVLSLPRR